MKSAIQKKVLKAMGAMALARKVLETPPASPLITLYAHEAVNGWVGQAVVPGGFLAARATTKVEALRAAGFLAAAYLDEVEAMTGVVSAAKRMKLTPSQRKRMEQRAKRNASKGGRKVYLSVGKPTKGRRGGWKATAVFVRKNIKGKDGQPRKFTQQIHLGGKSRPTMHVQGGKLMVTSVDSKTGEKTKKQFG